MRPRLSPLQRQRRSKDYTRAADLFRKAADQGDALAQYRLGYMYYNGYGVPKDTNLASDWFHKAADQGLSEAQYDLSYMAANSDGPLKDIGPESEEPVKTNGKGEAPGWVVLNC